MGAVIRYWVTVVAPVEACEEGLRKTVQDLPVYFYTENGIIASPRPKRVQRLFGVLVDLFKYFSLHMNMRKTVSMVFLSYHTPGGLLEAVYE